MQQAPARDAAAQRCRPVAAPAEAGLTARSSTESCWQPSQCLCWLQDVEVLLLLLLHQGASGLLALLRQHSCWQRVPPLMNPRILLATPASRCMFWRDLRPVIQCPYLAHKLTSSACDYNKGAIPDVLSYQGKCDAHGTIVIRINKCGTAISCRCAGLQGMQLILDPEHVVILLSSVPISSSRAGLLSDCHPLSGSRTLDPFRLLVRRLGADCCGKHELVLARQSDLQQCQTWRSSKPTAAATHWPFVPARGRVSWPGGPRTQPFVPAGDPLHIMMQAASASQHTCCQPTSVAATPHHRAQVRPPHRAAATQRA